MCWNGQLARTPCRPVRRPDSEVLNYFEENTHRNVSSFGAFLKINKVYDTIRIIQVKLFFKRSNGALAATSFVIDGAKNNNNKDPAVASWVVSGLCM